MNGPFVECIIGCNAPLLSAERRPFRVISLHDRQMQSLIGRSSSSSATSERKKEWLGRYKYDMLMTAGDTR